MEEEKRKAYSEVVEVLKLIENEEKMEKIPFEVIELIKANSDPTYKPTISKDIPLEDQNLKNETFSILGWIASKYWDEDIEISKENVAENTQEDEDLPKENKPLNDVEEKIEKVEESTLENVSVYNDIDPECLEKSNLPVLVSNVPWYQRLKIQVIRILKRIFRIKLENNREEISE